jgi:HKD family nuclease
MEELLLFLGDSLLTRIAVLIAGITVVAFIYTKAFDLILDIDLWAKQKGLKDY